VRAVAIAAAFCAAAASAASAQIGSPILFDPDLTVGAAASVSTTAGDALTRVDDAVPNRLFVERGVIRRGANVTYRLLKQLFVDAPQERLLMVINHELFGHGARLRELFDGPIEYHFDAPPPYGGGGGATTFVFNRDPVPYERLAVSVAGMEANSLAAAAIAHRAFSRRQMHAREAFRYLLFELDTFSYVRSTESDEEPGHDVADFLAVYDSVAGAGGTVLSRRQVRREALASLANPMLVYAAYGIVRYLWTGTTESRVPAFSFGGVRYLPLARYRLTPFGREWVLVNELGGTVRPTQIEVRFGRSPHHTPWGVALRQRELATWRTWSADASLEVWRQPRLTDMVTAEDARIGVEIRARAHRRLVSVWYSAHPATLVVDVGVKSAGFVPGEPLRGGLVVRAGAAVPLR
jgi:hypothetical protein